MENDESNKNSPDMTGVTQFFEKDVGNNNSWEGWY